MNSPSLYAELGRSWDVPPCRHVSARPYFLQTWRAASPLFSSCLRPSISVISDAGAVNLLSKKTRRWLCQSLSLWAGLTSHSVSEWNYLSQERNAHLWEQTALTLKFLLRAFITVRLQAFVSCVVNTQGSEWCKNIEKKNMLTCSLQANLTSWWKYLCLHKWDDLNYLEQSVWKSLCL